MAANEELDRVKRQIREIEAIPYALRSEGDKLTLAGSLAKQNTLLQQGMPSYPFL